MSTAQAADDSEPADEESLDELSEEERAALKDFDLSTVVVKAKRLSPAEETTAFAESLEVRKEVTRVQSVSEVLSDAVGVQVRRLGGLGSYGAASIRGSTPSQVPVYLDGVQLNAGGFDAVNLGDLSLDMLERIDVYRGSTPAHLGTAGIGGALHLHTRRFEDSLTEVALSGGSLDTFRLFGLRGDSFSSAGLRTLAMVSAQTSDGNFPFYNDNCTPTNRADDFTALRANNQHRSLTGLIKLDGDHGDWRWVVAENFYMKSQGVAGIDCAATSRTSLATLRQALTLKLNRVFSKSIRLSLDFSQLYLEEDFDDAQPPHGELGIGRIKTHTASHAATTGALLEVQPGQGHLTTARLELRYEALLQEEQISQTGGELQQRIQSVLSLQHEWNPAQGLSLLPAGRLIWQYNSFAGGGLAGPVGDLAASYTNDLFWQAGLGARWEFVPGWFVQANGGRYIRTPTMSEKFGMHGVMVGNPDLAEEQGYNADAGLIWMHSGPGALSALRAELAWFGTWADDLIVNVQNSQRTVRPENVDAARILGLESSLRLTLFKQLSLSANYTWLMATNQSDTSYYRGKRLPGRPVHELYARTEYAHQQKDWGLALWLDLDYAGQNYLNQYNNEADALARLLLGAGVRVNLPPDGLAITLEVKNMLNTYYLTDADGGRRPLRDFEAFPLPGRTIMTTVHWRH